MEHISDSWEAEMEELYGRGDGDPDFHTPPWETEAAPKHSTPSVYANKHWSQEKRFTALAYEPYEYADNDPASPEQNWEED